MKRNQAIGIVAVVLIAAGAVSLRVVHGRSVRAKPVSVPEIPKTALQVRPATPEEMKKPEPQEPAKPAPPIRVRFQAPAAGALGEPMLVKILVEAEPTEEPGRPALDLLLRLPAGVQLKSEGWEPVALPAEEQKDPTGPWSLFQKKISPDETPGPLKVEEAVSLAVVEPGTNWIVTVRARLTQGAKSWQTFGVIFASTDKTGVGFHTAPRGPENAQTN